MLVFAGTLAFHALVSAVPSAVITFWLTGMAVGADRVQSLGRRLAELAPGGELETLFQRLLGVGTAVGIGAIVAALWPATAYGSGLRRAFEAMTGDERRMPGLRGRLQGLLLLAGLPLLVIGALAAAWLGTGLARGNGLAGTLAGWAVALAVGTLVAGVALTVVYTVFGPDDLSRRSLAAGTATAATAISAASLGFMLYVEHGAGWQHDVAGSGIGVALVAAVWIYVVQIVLLAGYCLARVVDRGGPGPGSRAGRARKRRR